MSKTVVATPMATDMTEDAKVETVELTRARQEGARDDRITFIKFFESLKKLIDEGADMTQVSERVDWYIADGYVRLDILEEAMSFDQTAVNNRQSYGLKPAQSGLFVVQGEVHVGSHG